jgi:putative MFS transporter
VVEEVGFGKAQLMMLITGGAVVFNRGVQMCLMSILTVPIAADMGLTTLQQGMLSTVMFGGMFAGTVASGWFGDAAGRRIPVVASSISTVLVGCASAACADFHWLFMARLCLGFAMALGDVPVTALLSEVTPVQWRIPMRAATEGMFDLGYTYAAFLAACSDAYLEDLNWRKLMIITCIPPGVLGLAAAAFLPESPVFLISRGDSAEATQVFDQFRHLNGRPHACIDLEPVDAPLKARVHQSGVLDNLSVVFGPQYISTTWVLCFSAFVLNIFYYGGMYIQPQVMTQGNGLPPGWEMVLGGPFDLIGLCLAMALAQIAPRRLVLGFALASASFSVASFGYAGSFLVRTPVLEVMYQIGLFGFYWVPAVGFVVFGQLAVESYPTLVSATGGSVAFCMGRVGAMAAPLLFEHVWKFSGQWEVFCYLSSALCALGIGAVLALEARGGAPAKDGPHEAAPPNRQLSVVSGT